MIDNYFGGKLEADLGAKKRLTDLDKKILKEIKNSSKKVGGYLVKAEIRKGYRAVMDLARAGNVYFDRSKPWELMKLGKREEAKLVLRLAFFLARSLMITATPFMPEGMAEIWQKQFGFLGSPGDCGRWEEAGEVDFSVTYRTKKPKPFYSRIEDKDLEELEKDLGQKPALREIVGSIKN
jgi:methionyl-tRNA synthetase